MTTFREVSAALRAAVEFLQQDAGIAHSRLLPYSHVVPVLTRFVRLHGEPRDRTAHLLRRWVWRDAVAGTVARSTSVAAVRDAVGAVDAGGPQAAARALLRNIPRAIRFVPDLEKVHLNHAATKINLLGLLARGPRDLISGQPLDLATVFEHGNPVRGIVTDRAMPLAKSFANRAVVGPLGMGRSVRSALANAPGEIAYSHLVDDQAQSLLASGDVAGFLDRRAPQVIEAIATHVSTMAEWGARDGRTVAEMMRSAA